MGLEERGRLKRAFVFSLDAFTAFSLVLMTIYSLFMLVNLPKGYYSTLEQGYDLAKDTLTVLDHTPYPGGALGETYTDRLYHERTVGSGCYVSGTTCYKIAGSNGVIGRLIGRQWGYTVDYYANESGSAQWRVIYDTRADISPDNIHAGVDYRKVQASARTIISTYALDPIPGESPYCYLTGRGYNGTDSSRIPQYANPCNVTPCNVLRPNFDPGDISVGTIRITVFT